MRSISTVFLLAALCGSGSALAQVDASALRDALASAPAGSPVQLGSPSTNAIVVPDLGNAAKSSVQPGPVAVTVRTLPAAAILSSVDGRPGPGSMLSALGNADSASTASGSQSTGAVIGVPSFAAAIGNTSAPAVPIRLGR